MFDSIKYNIQQSLNPLIISSFRIIQVCYTIINYLKFKGMYFYSGL